MGRVVVCVVHCIQACVLLRVPPLNVPSLLCSLPPSLHRSSLTLYLVPPLDPLLPPYYARSLLRSFPPPLSLAPSPSRPSFPRYFPSPTLSPFLHSRSPPFFKSSLLPSLSLLPPYHPPSFLHPSLYPSLPACLAPSN